MEVQEISALDAKALFDSGDEGTFEPRGLFYIADPGDDCWIGIDNSTGRAWTEEFASYDECVRWLERQEQDDSSDDLRNGGST